jgi:hypothetical protein
MFLQNTREATKWNKPEDTLKAEEMYIGKVRLHRVISNIKKSVVSETYYGIFIAEFSCVSNLY